MSCKNKKTGRFLRERGTSGHDFDYVGAQPPLDTPRGVNYSEKRRTGFVIFHYYWDFLGIFWDFRDFSGFFGIFSRKVYGIFFK